jgi:hypothetical protein
LTKKTGYDIIALVVGGKHKKTEASEQTKNFFGRLTKRRKYDKLPPALRTEMNSFTEVSSSITTQGRQSGRLGSPPASGKR